MWQDPKDTLVQGSRLNVGSSQFCVLRVYGSTILEVYEAGEHIIHADDFLLSMTQLAFSGEPIPCECEALYINRAPLVVTVSGSILRSRMLEIDYRIDYSIRIVAPDDAVQFIQHMPHGSQTISTQDMSTYTEQIIREAVGQLVQFTPLEQINGKVQELSQVVHQRLQKFLSTYGITLEAVNVQGLQACYNPRTTTMYQTHQGRRPFYGDQKSPSTADSRVLISGIGMAED